MKKGEGIKRKCGRHVEPSVQQQPGVWMPYPRCAGKEVAWCG